MSNHPDGYPRASGDRGFSEQHIFAPLTNSPTADSVLPFESPLYTWTSPSCPDGARLWRLQTRERGVIRQVLGGNGTSLTRAQIEARLAAGSGGGQSADFQGQLPLEVNVTPDWGQSYSFRMDSNQSVEIYGRCVSATVLASTQALLVSPKSSQNINTGADSFFEDSLVGVDFQMVDAPLTQENVFYTEVIGIAGGTDAEIRIPERAVACEIVTSQTTAAWGMFIGDPAIAGRQTRTISFTGGVAEILIGNETHLQSDNAGGARQFRLRWSIKP